MEIHTSHYGEDHFQTGILKNLAIIYSDLGDLEKAKTIYEKTVEIENSLYGENHI